MEGVSERERGREGSIAQYQNKENLIFQSLHRTVYICPKLQVRPLTFPQCKLIGAHLILSQTIYQHHYRWCHVLASLVVHPVRPPINSLSSHITYILNRVRYSATQGTLVIWPCGVHSIQRGSILLYS